MVKPPPVFCGVPVLTTNRLIDHKSRYTRLRTSLLSGEIRTIPLQGIPGVGKTALALFLAHDAEVLAHFSDGVLWATLEAETDVPSRLRMWAQGLNLDLDQFPTEIDQAQSAIRTAIGQRRILIVIDNAWSAEAIRPFLLGGANCAYVITSRQKAVLEGFGVEPELVEELTVPEGTALLTEIAPYAAKHRPGQIRHLVGLVGGLPLALTLIGGYLRDASVLEQLSVVDQALDHLQQIENLLQIGEDRLTSVIGVSYENLDDNGTRSLRSLSVFPPKPHSFSFNAAQEIADVTVEHLNSLVLSGLLEIAAEKGFTIHPVIVDYARSKLRDSEEETRICARFTEYYARYAQAHKQDVAVLMLEWNNIVEAARIAADKGHDDKLVQIMGALAAENGYYDAFGHHDRHLPLLEKAAVIEEQKTPPSRNLLDITSTIANIRFNRQDYPKALDFYRRAAATAHSLGEISSQIRGLIRVADVLVKQGDIQQAQVEISNAYTLAIEIDDRTAALYRLAVFLTHPKIRNFETARQYLQLALKTARNAPQRFICLLNLGAVEKDIGEDFYQAIRYHQEALEIARSDDGNVEWQGWALLNLAEDYYWKGETERAQRCIQKAREKSQECNDQESLAQLKQLEHYIRFKETLEREREVLKNVDAQQPLTHWIEWLLIEIVEQFLESGETAEPYIAENRNTAAGHFLKKALEVADACDDHTVIARIYHLRRKL